MTEGNKRTRNALETWHVFVLYTFRMQMLLSDIKASAPLFLSTFFFLFLISKLNWISQVFVQAASLADVKTLLWLALVLKIPSPWILSIADSSDPAENFTLWNKQCKMCFVIIPRLVQPCSRPGRRAFWNQFDRSRAVGESFLWCYVELRSLYLCVCRFYYLLVLPYTRIVYILSLRRHFWSFEPDDLITKL